MPPRLFLLVVTAALLGTGGARAQNVKSPADLFPAKTLFYAEVRKPGPLAKEVRALFAYSVLGNVPASMAGLREKLLKAGVSPWQVQPLGAFGLALSPEVVKEVGRLKGAAVGLMGIDQRGEPEFLAVVLPGKSEAPAFFMRTMLTLAPMRVVGKVEGVPLYRSYSPELGRTQKDGPTVAVIRAHGPAFAMMPGALFIGTPAAVKDAIRRAKGKAESEALSKSATFQEASKDAGSQPGLFGFANVAPLLAEFIQHQEKFAKGGAEFVKLVNPKAFRSVAESITLNKGTFRWRETARLDPREKSPLLEALPAAPVNTELLHFTPKGATVVAALSNADGAKRWPYVLHILDTFARLSGERGLPSQHLKQMEEALHINFARDVAGKISNVGVAVGDLWNAPVRKVVRKGPGFESVSVSPQVPVVIIVQATDEAAAQKMTEDLLPRFFVGLKVGGKEAKPASKEVGGQTIYSLKLGKHEGLHYGRHGSTIVLGPYERPVVQALTAGASQKGWLANAKVAAALEKLKEPVAVAVVRPAAFLGAGLLMGGYGYSKSEARIGKAGGPDKAPPPRPEPKITVTVEEGPAAFGKQDARLRKELGKLLAGEEPLVLGVTRTADRIQGEATVGGLRPLVSRLTNFAIEKMMIESTMCAREDQRRLEEERRMFEKQRRLEEKRRIEFEKKKK